MHLKLTVFIICLWGYVVESSAMESVKRVLYEYGGFSSTSDSHYSDSLPSSPPSLGNKEIPYHFCKNGMLVASFNVGQGAFFLIKNANKNKVIVVDCGSINKSWWNFWDAVGKNVKSFLGDSTISACVITHPHTDHYNYLSNFLGEVKNKLEKNDSIIVGGGQMP